MSHREVLSIYRCRSCKNGVSTRDRLEDGTCALCSGPFDGPPRKTPASARAEIEALIVNGRRGRFDNCPVCRQIDIARTPTEDTCRGESCGCTFVLGEDGRWRLVLSEKLLAAYERQGWDPPGFDPPPEGAGE